jgi:hypothetical protein
MASFSCPQGAWQFQTLIRFPAVKLGFILNEKAERALI